MSKDVETSLDVRCPACNASIKYNPSVSKWKCDYCGSVFDDIEINDGNDEIVVDDYNDYISCKCESCGAEVLTDSEETAATFCVYCGNTVIIKSKLSGSFSPDQIIPFQIPKDDAVEAFKNLSKGRPLMPRKFNNPSNIEKIRGVYIPFWLYDLEINGKIEINAENVTRWSRGNTYYTKTDVYHLVRGGNMMFLKIPVDGSSKFDNDIMNSIEPFNYKKLIPFNHKYLSGFYAERYDEEGNNLYSEVESRAVESAKTEFLKSVKGYHTTRIASSDLKGIEKAKKYALLPVWMVNVKYKDKTYIFAMNGETGKFIGNIPLSSGKTVLYAICIFVITFLLCILISYIIWKVGVEVV